MTTLHELQPQPLWDYFQGLTRVPRPSHEETAVQEHILAEAQKLGLTAERDAAGNIRVIKPGQRPGPGVILQGHLDMVAQKNQDTVHDFRRDPIKAKVNGDWVEAEGTTLGADNGIGVAMILSVLADRDLQHPPLEALFTASEEVGMVGARAVRPNWLQGDWLINLDFEHDGELCVGCAGGLDANVSLPLQREALPAGPLYRLQLGGLAGGHSGVDIHKGRPNALKLLVEALQGLEVSALVSLAGGNLHNAIPREASAEFGSGLDRATLESRLQSWAAAYTDKGLSFSLQETTAPAAWVLAGQGRAASAASLLEFLAALPNGVLQTHTATGAVLLSNNLAVVQGSDDRLTVQNFIRAADRADRQAVADQIEALLPPGARLERANDYDGWLSPDDSPLVRLAAERGEKIFGRRPAITVVHAGLECGILHGAYPHWQMVSFGPTIENPHSPSERVHVPSVARSYAWLCDLLRHL